MKQRGNNIVYRKEHAMLIAFVMLILSFVYYCPELAHFSPCEFLNTVSSQIPYDFFRGLFFIPALYATYVFGLGGLAVVAAVAFLIFIPRALFFSPFPLSLIRPAIFTAGFFLCGYCVTRHRGARRAEDGDIFQETLENVFEIMPEGMLCLTADLNVWRENRAFREMLTGDGYGQQKGKGHNLRDIVLKQLKHRIEAGEYSGEIQVGPEVGGAIFTYRTAKTAYQGVSYFLVSLTDITQQKMAEEKLLKSEEEYRSLVESTDDSIYLVDRKCHYIFINEKHLSRLGLRKDQVTVSSYGDFHSKEETEEFSELVEKVFREGRSLQHEHKSLRDDRYFLRTLSPIKDTEGNVIAVTVISKDITDRKVAEEKMRYMAFHDALTGLYNRAYFEEEMTRINTERNYPVAIVVLDINGLKVVNDTMGHKMGDELIKNAARTLLSVARRGDVVARIGGDEFAVILPCCDEVAAQEFCARFREACRKGCKNFVTHLNLSVAIGHAVQSFRLEDVESVLKRADENMYAEKLSEMTSRESEVVGALKAISMEKDPHTEKPGERPQDLAERVGRSLGLLEGELNRLRLLALLHDIGKIAVVDRILLKPGKLTEEEWEIMKRHVEEGYKMAIGIPELTPIANEILYHHERWDGKGYPDGLKDGEIPLLARIVKIIDAYDAMLNERPHRRALAKDEAIRRIREGAGSQFDPGLVERFLEVIGSPASG